MLYKINPMHPLYGTYLCRMCQCGVTRGPLVAHRYTNILMRLLAAEPRSTTLPLLTCQCPCGTIFQTLYSLVWDWWSSRAGPMFIYWPMMLDTSFPSTVFHILFFLSIGWYCGVGVFRHLGCISLSPNLALPTPFNNNNNYNNYNNNNRGVFKFASL